MRIYVIVTTKRVCVMSVD